MKAEDFPRFEEKIQPYTPVSKSGGQHYQQQSAIIDQSVVSPIDPTKPAPKKRGRKPRSHYLALEAAAAAKKQAEEEAANKEAQIQAE